jgi:pilus assembly protein Flp/PilA
MITHPILWLSARTALWLSNRRAVTSIEYALIAALIAVIIISAITSVGKNISATFNKVASEL